MKRTIVLLISFCVFFGALFPVFSEEQKAFEKYDQALGFQGGQISGTGLSYQKWSDGLGLQFAFGALYFPLSEENSSWLSYSNILDYTVGAEAQYSVYGEDFADWLSGQLYLFAGLNHRGFIEKVFIPDEGEDTFTGTYEYGPYTPVLALGIGIGIEIILFQHFSMPFELGYGVFWSPTKSSLKDQFVVDLVPQAGFRYRF